MSSLTSFTPFFFLSFLNKPSIFYYNKLKLQQNDIHTKCYTKLKFKLELQGKKQRTIQKINLKKNKTNQMKKERKIKKT